VISAQAEGIPVLYSVIPHFLYSAAMSFKEPSSSVIQILATPRPAIDRFDIQRLIWENALNTIELVSFLDAVE
jgi:hypothetical protein